MMTSFLFAEALSFLTDFGVSTDVIHVSVFPVKSCRIKTAMQGNKT